MARQPKPWYWEARDAFYVTINGKQHRLHANKKEADREFYRLMAAEGLLDRKQSGAMTVADACESLIADSQHLRAGTLLIYNEKYNAFSGKFGDRRLDSIKPAEVISWVSNYDGVRSNRTISDSTRSVQFRYVKTLYKWARDVGHIAIDPFVRTPNPWHVRKRDSPMSSNDYEKIMSLPKLAPAFKEVMEFTWRTGIRPSELVILSARHMDARLPLARFQPAEHKTGRKTGLQREVFFPSDLWDRLKAYADKHKQGPLLRKTNGKPWTVKVISSTFNHVKVRYGLTCVLYQARHRWATAMIESGVPDSRVARMAGHSNTDVLHSTYYHPDAVQMAVDADAESDTEAVRLNMIAEKVAAKRVEAKAQAKERDRTASREYQRLKRARLKGEQGGASGT